MSRFRVFLRDVSIRTRLCQLVLVVALPFALYIVTSALVKAGSDRDAADAANLALAHSVATQLDNYLDDLGVMLAPLSHALDATEDAMGRNDALLQAMRNDLPQFVNGVVVWTIGGRNVGALDAQTRSPSISVVDRRYFQETLMTGQVAIEGPLRSRVNGDFIAIVARPMQKDGFVTGVVAAGVQLRRLQALTDRTSTLPPQGIITVINRQGHVVSSSDEGLMKINSDLSQDPIVRTALAERHGTAEASDAEHVPRLYGYATAQATPWLVMVSLPTSIALAATYAQLEHQLALGIAVLIVSLVLAALIAHEIVKPLRRLTQDARALGNGDLARPIQVHGRGEIGVLGETLGRMANEIGVRTAALAQSERRLRLIADNMPVLISYVDRQGRSEFMNRYGQDFFRDEAANDRPTGGSAADVQGVDTTLATRRHLDSALSGTAARFTHTYPSAKGPRDLALTYIPDLDAGGGVAGVYCLGVDVTAELQAQAVLRSSEERLQAIADNLPVLIAVVDRSLTYRFCNATFGAWTQRDPRELTGRTMVEVLGATAFAQEAQHIASALAGKTVSFESASPIDSTERHVLTTYVPLRGSRPDEIDGFYVLKQDLTERRAFERKLERMAQHDQLTGLPNRYLLHDRLAQGCHRSQREGTKLAVFFLDLDGFKPINDRLGHAAGDEVLREVARRLRASVRNSDTVSRTGGDEFVILIDGFGSFPHLALMAQNYIRTIESPMFIAGEMVHCSASIGVATHPPCHSWEALLEVADAAMYEAKEVGRGAFVIAPLRDELAQPRDEAVPERHARRPLLTSVGTGGTPASAALDGVVLP